MTLYDAAKHYRIYLQTLHLSHQKKDAYHRALLDIQEFYGQETDLDTLSEADVLDYVWVNDPFDCDPVHTERGSVYCNFIGWLMRNHMIPVWQSQMFAIEQEEDQTRKRQKVHSHPLGPDTRRVI